MAKEKIKICINAISLPRHLSGVGNYTYQLLLRLAEHNPDWEIHLVVPTISSHNFENLPGIQLIRVGVSSSLIGKLYLNTVFVWKTNRYALVHSVHNVGMLYCRTKQIITIHDCYERVSPERYSWIKRILIRAFISISGRNAVRIITVSQNSAADIAEYYPHVAHKITVIHNGNKYSVNPEAPSGRGEGFLFVGTMEPGKNLKLALKAFGRFRKKYGGNLKIVGARGWRRQPNEEQILHEMGVDGGVEFLGHVSDQELRELYGKSVALIQPSNYEGFGLPVIEAMACGCPVIAADNSGLLEAGGEAALFFKSRDYGDLFHKMEQVFLHDGLRKEHIRKGFMQAAKFDWERTAEETKKVYLLAC